MKVGLTIVGALLIYVIVMEWHNAQRSAPEPAAATAAPSSTIPENDRALVVSVANAHDVPAGLLYAGWRTSGGLHGGWGSGDGWHRAADLVSRGSRCIAEHGEARCRARWDALVAVCGQRRNGAPLCDPNEVRTSSAVAMGPMRLVATDILTVRADRTTVWSEYAADFDGDGVVDPHSLADALAMAAKRLRSRFDRRDPAKEVTEAWIDAGVRAGFGTRPAISDHWRQWCEITGMCAARTMLASNP